MRLPMRSTRFPGIQAFLWAVLAAVLEAALRRREVLWRVANILPLAFGAGIAFVVGRLLGLALIEIF
jgi:hypothetical protein